MRRILFKIVGNIIALYLAAWLLPSIRVDQPQTLVWAGIILGAVNLLIRPLLLLLMLPFNLITFGLLTIVINTWMLMLTDSVLTGMKIPGFWVAVLVSLIISAVNILLQDLFPRT